jgi:hypothetical protein
MYYFPKWLLNRAICIALINSAEPTASLKIPRIIDPQAEIFEFAAVGNVEGIRKLLEERKASPNDIKGNFTRRSILHVCVLWPIEQSGITLSI